MAETVEFPSNGTTASGYLVKPASGSGPGVLVIQEWWGLDADMKEWANRLGAAGFVALAPDLYHGEVARHDEMDKASHLMQTLPPDRAARDMSGAVDYLAQRSDVSGRGIGVVGFCIHAGTGHAFMGPHNALGTLNAALAAQIWPRATSFLKETLG
jgi:carboxymethylenebutenolidase